MKIILSPAKNMNIKQFKNIHTKKPIFEKEVLNIVEQINNYEPYELESLMKINPEIALKTFCYFKDFDIKNIGGHSLASYDGLVFKNINADDFNEEDILFSEEYLRILSGLYGVLTPCTNIFKYRLEMQCKLQICGHKNLYEFWGSKIYKQLYKDTNIILNLASKEYYKTITPFLNKNNKMINVEFIVHRGGKNKVVATSAKMARGKMARYIIKNKITNIEEIKLFDLDDYNYNDYLSDENNIIFLKNMI